MGNQEGRGPAILGGGTLRQGQPIVVGGGIDPNALAINPNRERDAANHSIAVAYRALDRQPGAPLTAESSDGLAAVEGGFFREYQRGRIYTKRGVGTFFVYGAIGDRYAELGGPSSWLGWPVSTELPLDDGEEGRVVGFQNGGIYWWPDTGPIELGNIALRYKGIVCFGETDWDAGSDSDEPYAILGVVRPVLGGQGDIAGAPKVVSETHASSVYPGVDAIESRGDHIDLYVGPPGGVVVRTTIMEQDFGTPEEARRIAAEGVREAAGAIGTGLGYVPYVGPILGKAAERAINGAESDIAEAVQDLFDLHDDTIGTDTLVFTPKRLATMTRAPEQEFKGIHYRTETQLISREGASYKAYFDVQQA